MTKADLAVLAESQVGSWCYVWGGNGEDMSSMTETEREKYICKHESSESNRSKIRTLYLEIEKSGRRPIRGGDCSGFVFWCMKTLDVWKSDTTADGMYRKTERVSLADLQAGDLAFKVNSSGKAVHVGVYVGNGYFVHCKGRASGVVKEKSKNGYWTAYGIIKEFKPEPEPKPEPSGKKYVLFHGSVNIRHNPIKDGRSVIKIMHDGQTLPYIEDVINNLGERWYKVDYNGRIAFCSAFDGQKKKYTEVIEA